MDQLCQTRVIPLLVGQNPCYSPTDLLASDVWEGTRSSFGDTINPPAGDARDVENFYSTLLATAKPRGDKASEEAAYVFLISFF